MFPCLMSPLCLALLVGAFHRIHPSQLNRGCVRGGWLLARANHTVTRVPQIPLHYMRQVYNGLRLPQKYR